MKYSIVVIGAGGTGSYFLKEISRFIAGRKDIESLSIFDGDTVEEKNLSRQAFTAEDIGRNKASVMAEVLNEAFGLKWRAYPRYLTKPSEIKEAVGTGSCYGRETIPVIVSCVDNHGARLVLEKAFASFETAAYFDSANEFSTGEVVFAYRENKRLVGPPRSYFFPDMREGDIRNREEISCEELNRVEPQHIFTNMMAGNLLCSGVSNLMEGRATPGVVYFNAQRMSSQYMAYAPAAEVEEIPKKKPSRKSSTPKKHSGAA